MRTIPASELIINDDGSIFHLHLLPEQLADTVILVGDPGRVALVAEHFDTKECEVANREFKTVTGTYKGKRMTVLSTSRSRSSMRWPTSISPPGRRRPTKGSSRWSGSARRGPSSPISRWGSSSSRARR